MEPKHMDARRSTLADVARLAGVSPTTASQILNGRNAHRFSVETKTRLEAAVSELNYRPNLSARNLRVSKTATVGFISDHVATTRFASGMIRGALAAAARGRHTVLIAETGGVLAEQKLAVESLMDRQVDGIVFASMTARHVDLAFEALPVPAVLLNCTAEASIPTVLPDEYEAGRAVARYVVEHGLHERIALIGFSDELARDARRSATIGRRFAGIFDELAAQSVTVDRVIDQPLWVRDTGEAAAHALLAGGYRPSVIICMNDPMAFGAFQAMADLGVAIPDDVSLISFDDDEVASYLRPRLTTAALPYEEMGAAAVEMLMGARPSGDLLVPMPLLERGSTAPAGH